MPTNRRGHSPPKYHYAIVMGSLWRFSQRNWRNFCKVSALQWADAAAYGVLVQMDCPNVTDWSREDFSEQVKSNETK